MAACPGCQKFASLELQDPEEQSEPEIDGSSGEVSCEVRIVRNSACCGEEMKEATLELTADISAELDAFIEDKVHAAQPEGEADAAAAEALEEEIRDGLEVQAEFTGVEETQNTYQRGKKKGQRIPNPRYWTSLFGAEMTGTVTYQGEVVAEFSVTETVPASGMEELV